MSQQDNELDVEAIVEQHKEETSDGRTGTKAAVEQQDDTDDSPSLEDAVRDAYDRIDAGDAHTNLTIRDKDLAALFAGLDETSQLEAVGEDAATALDRDEDTLDTRATVLKLLVRVGLEEVAEETVESAKEGRQQFLTSKANEF